MLLVLLLIGIGHVLQNYLQFIFEFFQLLLVSLLIDIRLIRHIIYLCLCLISDFFLEIFETRSFDNRAKISNGTTYTNGKLDLVARLSETRDTMVV